DENAYLAAMRRVPIMPPSRLPAILGFLTGFAALLAEMGLERLRQEEIRRTLTAKNREFQTQRQAAINLAEDAQIARLASEQASEALRQSEARFCSFMENLPIIAGMRDRDGRILFVNRVYGHLLDMRPEEVMGKRIEDLYVPEQARIVAEHDADVLENNRPQTFSETVEFHGDEHFFLTARFPIPANSFEEVKLGFIALDVTEQKRAEEQLRRERDFSKTLVETSPTFFVAIDPDGKTVMMNEVMLATLGYRPEEIVGKNYIETFVPEADRPLLAEVFGRLTHDQQPTVNENRVLTRDGRAFPVEWHGGPVRDAQGNVEYFFGVGIDITDRKRAEREREALIQKLEAQNAELERFAYSVSHDLKSPLITIQGFLGILREDLAKQDAEAVGHDLMRIANAAGRMERLLGDVLELSRIGRLVKPSEHVSLANLASEAVKLVEGRIKERHVDIHIASDLPVVFGDRSRLLDVLQNLIDNAAKYMGDQPQPRVEIGCRDDRGETACFVRDNGMGIEPRYFESIFGLFEQLNPQMEGTGIGLALAKRIIELHGGRIWVESAGPGQGSTFLFTLPPPCAEDVAE
ncbi:MAG TPA: hypothetical protein DD670_18885, partial [Planctomycetaceae bacterium]|nr:hypothetical protein [Planctomycetaceae bacterium]